MIIVRGIVGLLLLISIGFLFSENRKAIDWKLVGAGLFLQVIFGIAISQSEMVAGAFETIGQAFVTFLNYSADGAAFLFGGFVTDMNQYGFIFAFQVLPTIIFFAAVTSGLYYLGVLQKFVYVIAWVMSKSMRLSGAESLSAAGNIFLGQTESPLLVKPFIEKMTRSELMCLMTGGMATLAGGVLAGYVKFLGGEDPVEQAKFANYLLTASIMNAPAAIVMAKMLVPETKPELIDTKLRLNKDKIGSNFLDAVSNGTSEGLNLALNVGAMLLSFIAIIAALNGLLGWIGDLVNINHTIAETTEGQFGELSLQYLFGLIFRPIAFIIGVDWDETLLIGSLLGQKTVINEFVAYDALSKMKEASMLSDQAVRIATYALCGFSNFSSIAIQIGGIGSLAPSRKGEIATLGTKSLLAASVACLMTATVAGTLMN
ncbi:NupC/NupG family nucleoside CNT transporter [Sediminitomix flava]|uniref:CNT family concentrative nucleoside transporter n=1 Tax=Sediminitomix flava TaxID=379075 RepID=A0A315Z6C8_SEDFL|nr:nucleoside transporter C-terminal domain-containing protein [Sediminitomix flava]PWJ39978.1 CNT family concentrative nucleoside transporter [Sediminitomix flava]